MSNSSSSTSRILSITGSDNMGDVGIQADVTTIIGMGGHPLTVVTAITVQDRQSIHEVHPLDPSLITAQVRTVISSQHPSAIKVGLVCNADTMRALRQEIVGCQRIVLDPGIISSSGQQIMDDETLQALISTMLPVATLLMLKCSEAEFILGSPILSDDDMLQAARRLTAMGPQWVMLRGGSHVSGQLTALLYGDSSTMTDDDATPYAQFFTSYNMEGWQRHGVGGALSTAIATRLGMGDDVPTAISQAHEYIHSQVVYGLHDSEQSPRIADLYNQLLSLIADHYQQAHDVRYYADLLCITPRYLSQVTDRAVDRSPKQVIDNYLLQASKVLLRSSRLTIQEVASRLGFASQAAFGRFFRQHTQTSPSEYRGL